MIPPRDRPHADRPHADRYGARGEGCTYASYYGQSPPVEMPYDLGKDPMQLSKLAADPEYSETLTQMRSRTESYIKESSRPEIMEPKAAGKNQR
jgi:hypothetical protein